MEEDLNENDLEERLYAMLHYVDETQANVKGNTNEEDVLRIVENAPRSTLRRYWNTNADVNTPNQKVNTLKEKPPTNNNNVTNAGTATKCTDEKQSKQNTTKQVDLSVFQSPVPKDVKKTIEIIENDDCGQVVELNSSDEDEVIEVALPPKPTITIESSDDEELKIISKKHSPTKEANAVQINSKPSTRERDVSASPVPSVVSSVSDEFIRGDCIALKISSKHPDNHSFDFSLHGSDLIDHRTPSKKKKKKRSKERITSTPIDSASTQDKPTAKTTDECFATPKSKAKNKRQKNKSSLISEKIISSVDIYDSDSNNSMDNNKSRNSYIVTEKSIPSSDVYESDSSQSESPKEVTSKKVNDISKETTPSTTPFIDISENSTPNTPKNRTAAPVAQSNVNTPNSSNDLITIDETGIDENIVMANVTGFTESEDYGDEIINSNVLKEIPKLGSTNVPAILFEDLDFDNLKGNSKVCRRRKYSLTALRTEMEKFYNESWGGENFNHREIQKYMSRDKSLWVIDPKDRMPAQYKKKTVSCNYCNRPGHRDDMCQLKPPVCYMCGSTGHYEPRCPKKICVNCGSPNYMYSKMCRNCSMWGRIKCAECGQYGHPSSHCPDIWRRYHNTIDANMPLEENRQYKKHHQLFCSGCTRRGHLVHTCRISLPFSGLPINSPYVHIYAPVYIPTHENISENETQQDYENTQSKFPNQEFIHRNERHKRQSKSPTVHETHVNKKRNISSDASEERCNAKSPVSQQKKLTQSKETTEETVAESSEMAGDAEKAPDFIPLNSSNHDKMGQVIQDNEVSDSSDVITSARIYLTKEVLDKLKNEEGEKWLSEMTKKHNIIVEHMDMSLFFSVKGRVGDQEAFQSELRNWSKDKSQTESAKSDCEADVSHEADVESPITDVTNIPKNRFNLLRKLNKALESLKQDIGDPNALYKELTYLQNHHQELLKQKVISPKRLSNNRVNINNMLTKLNMILLGQAGLADGPEHLSELYSIQKKLTSFRQKHVSADLRREIGDHYHSIFTAIPRDDYVDLLNKYYILKQRPVVNKNAFRLTKYVQKKNFNSIPPQPKNFNKGNGNQAAHLIKNIPQVKNRIVEKAMNKLTFYHKRILHSQPGDTVLRKTRSELVRRLRSRIQHLESNPSLSSKSLKKMKKIQDQAQLFLTNV